MNLIGSFLDVTEELPFLASSFPKWSTCVRLLKGTLSINSKDSGMDGILSGLSLIIKNLLRASASHVRGRQYWMSYVVKDVTDDFKVAGVFISSRKRPLKGPVVAVIHLEKNNKQ